MDAKAEDDAGLIAAFDGDPVGFVRKILMPDGSVEDQGRTILALYES